MKIAFIQKLAFDRRGTTVGYSKSVREMLNYYNEKSSNKVQKSLKGK